MSYMLFIVIGFLGGFVGGGLGLGGGAVMVPLLVILAGLTQHQAQGTVVALLSVPVMFFAALRYYHEGHIQLSIVGLICIGFIAGAFLGAHIVQNLPSAILKKVFGFLLILIGIKMAFFK